MITQRTGLIRRLRPGRRSDDEEEVWIDWSTVVPFTGAQIVGQGDLFDPRVGPIELRSPHEIRPSEDFNEAWVESLAQMMRDGAFIPVEPLLVENHDVLIDGHHRLEAAIRAGAPLVAVQEVFYKPWSRR